MSIDSGRKTIISKINQRIQNNNFDEIDICTLLILIRDLSTENRDFQAVEWKIGNLHEMCDYVAHRKRDRGFIVEEANYIYGHSTTTGFFHTGTTSKRTAISGLFEDAIISEINSIFQSLELATIPPNTASDILLCIIVLLQGAEYCSPQNVKGFLYSIICDDEIMLLSHTNEAGLDPVVMRTPNKQYYKSETSEVVLMENAFRIDRQGDNLCIIIPEE